MGFKDEFDKLKNKAKDTFREHEEESREGVDKAANMADEKTDHKHTDKIQKGADSAKDAMKRMTGK